MMSWTTLWPHRHTMLAIHRHSITSYHLHNHLHLHELPRALSLWITVPGNQSVDIAFRLTMKTFRRKDLPLYLLLHHYHPLPQGHQLCLASYCMCAILCVQVKIDLVFSVNTTTAHLMTLSIPCLRANSQTVIEHHPHKLIMFLVRNYILHPGPSKTCPFTFSWNGWLPAGTGNRSVKSIDWREMFWARRTSGCMILPILVLVRRASGWT